MKYNARRHTVQTTGGCGERGACVIVVISYQLSVIETKRLLFRAQLVGYQ